MQSVNEAGLYCLSKLPSFLFFKLNIEIIVYSHAHVGNTTEGHPVSVVTLCITVVCYHSQEIDMDTVHQQTPVDLLCLHSFVSVCILSLFFHLASNSWISPACPGVPPLPCPQPQAVTDLSSIWVVLM